MTTNKWANCITYLNLNFSSVNRVKIRVPNAPASELFYSFQITLWIDIDLKCDKL